MGDDEAQLRKFQKELSAGTVSLVLLAVLGADAERVAGGGGIKGALRVLLWGSLAQGATALIGWLFGVNVG